MDIKFENKFYTTDKMLKEYVSKVLSRNIKRIFLVFILIFIFLKRNNILRKDIDTFWGLLLVIVILWLLNFLNQKYLFRLIKKTSKSIHNDEAYELLYNLEAVYFYKKESSHWM